MATSFADVLTAEDIQYLNQLPEVLAAKEKVDTRNVVYFSVPLTETIRSTLHARLGLDLTQVSTIPMRWIKGDTAPHVDVTATRSQFHNTYLIYLNDSPGEFIVDDKSYPIRENTAFVFDEGLSHGAHHTANTSRLLLGPMSEQGVSVGVPTTIITQEMIDMLDISDGVFILTSSYYEINANLTVPSYVYFSTSVDGIIFEGNDYSITIVSNTPGTPYGGLFEVTPDDYEDGLQVRNLTVHAQNVVLDSSAGWFFRYGTRDVFAIRCNSTGEISGIGSGGIYGANVGNFGSVTRCFSTGNITGAGAGGIFGQNSNLCNVYFSYSWGDITGEGAGGLYGANAYRPAAEYSYSLGNVGTTAGGICGVNAVITGNRCTNLYVANASGRFFAGSNEVPANSTWSSGWSDVDASGALVFSNGDYFSWSPNTPYRLIAPTGSGSTPEELTAFISQLTETASASVNMGNLNLTPDISGQQEVTFIPNGGVATVDPTATVYIVGTARTTSSITLNGVAMSITFNDGCTFSFNGGNPVSAPAVVTVGAITFNIIACGSLVGNVRSANNGFCVTQKYKTNEERVSSVRGNLIGQGLVARPTQQFKTYADYITYIKSGRGCCC